MKKNALLLLCFFVASTVFGQLPGTQQPVYLRFPTVPEFNLYKAPDSTLYTRVQLKKNKPVMFFIFSPECGHCQKATEMLVKNIDKFKNIQILMVSYFPLSEIRQFYNQYKLGRFANITVSRDTKFYFPTFFQVRNFPSYYIYDSKWNFKKFLEGDVTVEMLTKELTFK